MELMKQDLILILTPISYPKLCFNRKSKEEGRNNEKINIKLKKKNN